MDRAGFAEAEQVFRRDRFICQYCSVDGTTNFAAWQSLTWDHLLPHRHPNRRDHEFIVTACQPCNAMLSRYFEHARATGEKFDTPNRQRLLEARRRYIKPRLNERKSYWQETVSRSGASL